MPIADDLKTTRFLRHFSTKSFACFGGIALLLQTNDVINPSITVFQGMPVLIGLVVISIIGGVILSWPRPISQEYNSPKTKITIVKGDLFLEQNHIVIGAVNTFDTETPVIIASRSLQGQALQRLYGGDINELNSDLDKALHGKPVIGTLQKKGKQNQYGVGTVASVKQAGRFVFFSAYCEMDAANTASSTPDRFWKSLGMLWDEISLKGNGRTVSMPVIGGGQARLSGVMPAQDAIRFTLLSFMFASRKSRICDELRIVVSPEDYNKMDRLELQSFLSSLRAS